MGGVYGAVFTGAGVGPPAPPPEPLLSLPHDTMKMPMAPIVAMVPKDAMDARISVVLAFISFIPPVSCCGARRYADL